MSKTCWPLEFAKGMGFNQLKGLVREFAIDDIFEKYILEELEAATAEDFLHMIHDKNYFKKSYNGPLTQINRCISIHPDMNRRLFQNERHAEEWKDLISMSSVVDIWSRNKQIYEFDADFVSELSKTEKLKLYPSLLKRLPYNTFYVDFSGCPQFKPFDGVFVYVEVYENDDIVVLAHRTVKDIFYTCTAHLQGDVRRVENGVSYYDYDRAYLGYKKEVPLSEFIQQERGNVVLSNESFPDIIMFLMQALMYLSSKEPDVGENPQTKKTYRPSVQVKNRYSEIRKWDVGIRYGNKVRLIKQQMGNKEAKNVSDDDVLQKEPGHRKSPRPHSRCAHWTHYWTGPGRKVLEVRWIEPTFVGSSGVLPVTKHKVSE